MTRRKTGWLRVSLGVRLCRRPLGLKMVLRGLSEPSFILSLLELMVYLVPLSNASKPYATSPLNQKVLELSQACAGLDCFLRKRPHFGQVTCLTHSALDWRD